MFNGSGTAKRSLVARQSGWQVASRFYALLCLLITASLCARFASHHDFGVYGLAALFSGVLTVLMEAGFGSVGLALLAMQPGAAGGVARLRVQAVGVVAGLAGLIVPVLWLVSPDSGKALLSATVAATMMMLGAALQTEAQAAMRSDVLAKATTIGQSLGLAVSVVIIMVNPTLWLVLLSLPALYSVRTVVGIWMLRRAGLLHWGTLPKVQAKELRRSAAPLTGWNVVGVLHLRVGGLAAYVVLGVTASAPLALPQRLLECAPIIPQALMTVALPLLVRSFCGDTVRYRMVREELLQMVCLVGLLIGNLINLFAPLLASLLGGGSYPNATLLLRIGSLTLIVVLVNALFVNLMIVQGEQGRALKRGLVSLVLNAGLCVGLTLLFGLVGAAWAMAVSELTLTVLMGMLVWKGQERPQVNLAVRYAAVSVIAYIASLLFHPADWEASAVALAVWLLAVPILMKPTLNLMRTAMGDARHSKSAPTADDNLMNPLVAA